MSTTDDTLKKRQLALVTGASGFIGKHLCAQLLEKGFSVRVFVRARSGFVAPGDPGAVDIQVGELTDSEALVAACSEVDCVFHLAGLAHAGLRDGEQFRQVNVEGTRALAKACLQAGVPRLVYFSSILARQVEEDNERASEYARSKKTAEEIVLRAAGPGFSPAVLRPVNVYGPGMKGNIAGLIGRIQQGRLPPLPQLSNRLSLVSVQDLCAAAILASQNPVAGGQIYPVTDGREYTPNALETAIYASVGRKKPSWRSPRVLFYAASLGAQILNNLGVWNNDLGLRSYRNLVANSTASCEKITTELGYQPTRRFEDELPEILKEMDSRGQT